MAYTTTMMAMALARALDDIDHYVRVGLSDRNQRKRNCSLDKPQVATCNVKPSNIGKDGFQVSIDVQQFRPNELTVKVVDRTVVVEGKHEERDDQYGSISRHFIRRYTLPKDYDVDGVASMLSSDGILTITAPKPSIDSKNSEKTIAIQQTGPAHLNIRDNPEESQDPKPSNGNQANKVAIITKK